MKPNGMILLMMLLLLSVMSWILMECAQLLQSEERQWGDFRRYQRLLNQADDVIQTISEALRQQAINCHSSSTACHVSGKDWQATYYILPRQAVPCALIEGQPGAEFFRLYLTIAPLQGKRPKLSFEVDVALPMAHPIEYQEVFENCSQWIKIYSGRQSWTTRFKP